jgi:hypothetical protein
MDFPWVKNIYCALYNEITLAVILLLMATSMAGIKMHASVRYRDARRRPRRKVPDNTEILWNGRR